MESRLLTSKTREQEDNGKNSVIELSEEKEIHVRNSLRQRLGRSHP